MKKKIYLLVLLLLTAIGGWATVVEGTSHYLYNVGAQKWLNFGNPE